MAAGGADRAERAGQAAEAANNAQQTSNQSTAAAENSGVSPSDTQTSTSSGSGLPVGGGTTAATNADGTAAAPVGLETVPLDLEFVGDFFNLADFFHRVKRFVSLTNDNVIVSGRLVTVDSVRWASDPELFPQHQGRDQGHHLPVAEGSGRRPPARPRRVRPTDRPRRRQHPAPARALPRLPRPPRRPHEQPCRTSSSTSGTTCARSASCPWPWCSWPPDRGARGALASPRRSRRRRRPAATPQAKPSSTGRRSWPQVKLEDETEGNGSTLDAFDPSNPFKPPQKA